MNSCFNFLERQRTITFKYPNVVSVQPRNKVITSADTRKQAVWGGNCAAFHRILKLVFSLNQVSWTSFGHLSLYIVLSHFIFS